MSLYLSLSLSQAPPPKKKKTAGDNQTNTHNNKKDDAVDASAGVSFVASVPLYKLSRVSVTIPPIRPFALYLFYASFYLRLTLTTLMIAGLGRGGSPSAQLKS